MVNNPHLDLVFYALSDSTRRSMLRQLAKKECSVSELAEPHDMSFAGASKHLKVLEKANFVEKTREGRTFRCRINLAPLDPVQDLLEELGNFWRTQLDSLESFLTNTDKEKGETDGNRKYRDRTSKSRRKKDHSSESRKSL